MRKLSLISKIYVAVVVMAGMAVLVKSALVWHSPRPAELLALLVMTLIASRLKIKLPGINGTMSVNLPFLLIVAVRLNSSEAAVVAALASLVQCIPAAQRPMSPLQAIFSSAAITQAVAAAAYVFSFSTHRGLAMPLAIAAAGAAFFLVNTILVALVLWLAEGEGLFKTWRGMVRLSVPYYCMSAGIAAIVCAATQFAIYAEALALLPLMYSVYTSYRIYFAAAETATAPAEPKPMGRATAAIPTPGSAAVH